MRLRLRRRPALILRRVRRLRRMGRLRMRLGSGVRLRRRRGALFLPVSVGGKQRHAPQRDRENCAAPCIRIAYAFHVHPKLICRFAYTLMATEAPAPV